MTATAETEPGPKRPPSPPISALLRAVLERGSGETIPLRAIVDTLGDRAMAIVMILFCLPNCIPLPPGVGLVFGFPMLLVALQMALGRHKPWLPRSVLDREIRREHYEKMMDLAEPRLKRVETYLRPRLAFLFSNAGDRLIGLFFVLCAVSVIVPLPGSNFPPAVAAVLMSLAIMEEDGIVLLVGLAIGVLGLVYTTLLGGTLIYAAWAALKALVGF